MRKRAKKRLILLAVLLVPLLAISYACCVFLVEQKRAASAPDKAQLLPTRWVGRTRKPPPPDYPTESVEDTYTTEPF